MGGRGIRGWKKLHLGVDGSGVIVAHALTGGHVDDATTALDLIDKVEGDVSCLTADAAYDTRGIYEAAGARGATVVISTDQDSHRVWTATTIARARPHDPTGCSRLDGDSGRRTRATISRPVWRTPSSGTS